MDDEDSEKALLSKKERKKAAAARKRTQQRFEGLLSVGSVEDETSDHVSRRSRPKERTKTADESLSRPKKRTPNMKKKSKSEENLLQANKGDLSMKEKLSEEFLRKEKSSTRQLLEGEIDSKVSSTHTKKIDSKVSSTHTKKIDSKVSSTHTKKKERRPPPEINEDYNEGTYNNGYDKTSLHGNETQADEHTMNDVTEIEKDASKVSQRKKKRRKPKDSTADRIYKALEKKRHDDGLLLCVILHKADQLVADARLRHPMVQVHLVNMDTGQYVKKTDSMRNVTSIFESKNENVDYILPVMSQPYDFKKTRSFTPIWNEMILYNEIYSYFLQRESDDPPVIVFFELIDFVLMSSKSSEISKTQKGWYKIAWAFLKLVSPSGATNTDKKARLQLYKPHPQAKLQSIETAGIEIYQWWKYKPRLVYPSSLTVTLKGVLPPAGLSPRGRSMFPTQQERGSKTFEELDSTMPIKQSSHNMETPIWDKMPGQVNRIPNELKVTIPTGKRGCSIVRFSHEGRYIACACSTNDGHPIKIFHFPSGEFVASFNNHFGIVYDLRWSPNDKELLSASADSTVRLWDTKRFETSCIKLFPHPAFVYTAQYHAVQPTIVVTGCYDNYLRVWSKISTTEHAVLLRELSGHNSFINTITFLDDGNVFFSADSNGRILQWCSHVSTKKNKTAITSSVDSWKLMQVIELPEIKNTVINTIATHPNQLKILVHTRDSLIRMLDLRNYGILKTYLGGLNIKEHIHACFSNCGSFVFCGTENGFVNVWDTETGDLLWTYDQLGYNRSITDIHFHKHDNFIAFCCYGDAGQPVQIFQYNPQVNLKKLLTNETEGMKSTRLIQAEENLINTTVHFESFQESKKEDEIYKKERMKQLEKNLQNVFLSDGKTLKKELPLKSTTMKSPLKSTTMKSAAHETMLSTWGSDFSRTNASAFPSIHPTPSPHAHQYLGASGRFHTMSPPTFGQSGSIDMYLDETNSKEDSINRPVFTFNRKSETMFKTSRKPTKFVRAIYEYRARRSDELTLHANDRLKVLYEDSAEWWMGENEEGQQGYFPASYVQEEIGAMMSDVEHSAVVDKHGELKILTTANPNKRKTRKKMTSSLAHSTSETNC